MKQRLFLCNGASAKREKGRVAKELISIGGKRNVYIDFENTCDSLCANLSSRIYDFLEIASFIYSADSSTGREGVWENNYATEQWDRDFQIAVAVRNPDFWNDPSIKNLLCEILSFLSDDIYDFDFQKLPIDRHVQEYFNFGECINLPHKGIERVLLFSGGLDSLAGAVLNAGAKKETVLVSHRPVHKLSSRQIRLSQKLQETFEAPILHVPVWINKEKSLGREFTQRTRSFLFLAIASVIAEPLQAKGISFYENGIVSLNLPVADEAIRARASRTTHPQSLYLFKKLCEAVFERSFEVDNPFIFKTKAEVVKLIDDYGAADLIRLSASCAHTGFFQSKNQWHCGACSQCIDRRVAILASSLQNYDDDNDYVTDVFYGKRKFGYEQNMAVNYARHSNELNLMSEDEIATRFSLELTRAIKPFQRKSEAAKKFVEMHKRHAKVAWSIIKKKAIEKIENIIDGDLEESSMIALIVGKKHKERSWKIFADRIVRLINDGLPAACQTYKPNNETHLQEICDGILKANNLKLQREYPFLRWASRLTKPDWSSIENCLWVEVKYIRKKSDIFSINEAIAADLTKYGDNGKHVQFLTYDPYHLLIEESEFNDAINTREWARSDIVR